MFDNSPQDNFLRKGLDTDVHMREFLCIVGCREVDCMVQSRAYNMLGYVRRTNCTTQYRGHMPRDILADNGNESIEPIHVRTPRSFIFAGGGVDMSYRGLDH